MAETRKTVTLAELELEPIVSIAPETTLRDTSRLLERCGLGTVVVESDPIAVVAERDIVVAVAEGHGPDCPVGDILAEEPMFVARRASVETAVRAMLHAGRRSLVVVDDAYRPLGIVTLTAAVAALVEGPPWLGALKLALHIEQSLP